MTNAIFNHVCRAPFAIAFLLVLIPSPPQARANPTGGTVTQGAASFSASGSQFNVNQTSANALINWQTFNIGAGETVNFNQPSATSVAWNQVNDSNPSQILGNLNANGYVILQNPNGFAVGGSAAINAHGLVMTTAATPALNLSSGGAWAFDAPPPAAKIVNYGQINISGGGSAFLIASDIENKGAISAPGGKIGLYAGQTVLVSSSPDGRGLNAKVTLPKGSVDNEGKLIADAGSIAAQAQYVNQNGLIQANSVQNNNGTIELVASGSMNLGANSVVSAQGDARAESAGGSVTIKSDVGFSDQPGSTINISGGAQGGNGGTVEVSAPSMAALNTKIIGTARPGWTGGSLLLDPDYIELSASGGDSLNVNGTSGSVSLGDAPGSTLYLDVGTSGDNYFDSAFVGLSQILLQAKYDITLDDGTTWNLSASTGQSAGSLFLEAGGNIIFNGNSRISDANNWSVSLQAGYDFAHNTVQKGIGSIYLGDFDGSNPLNNSGSIQTAKGSISLMAGQGVLVGSGSVTTIKGGSIDVTALSGDVNTGDSQNGFNYLTTAPYYTPFSLTGFGTVKTINYNQSNLGGISTAAGGDVTISAGNDVISFPAATVALGDPGTGAFGPEAGNVNITAGGSVYGHFVEANGTGIIKAGQNVGYSTSTAHDDVSLSLVKGSWSLYAGWDPVSQTVQSGAGDIYLQEVRNPNGVFNGTASGGTGTSDHLFDYDPSASVSLAAGNGVNITGYNLPRPNGAVPLIMAPTLTVNAGPGGVTLDTPTASDGSGSVIMSDSDITLYPSAHGNLEVNTTGGGWLRSGNSDGTDASLLMSDSGQTQWFIAASGSQPFSETDHASTPPELNNNDSVMIHLTGSQTINSVPVPAGMENIILQTDKKTVIEMDGDMKNCSFYGENLHPGDATSITVGGQIYNAGSFTPVTLVNGFPDLVQLSKTLPAGDTFLPPGTVNDTWYTILQLAVNTAEFNRSLLGIPVSQLSQYLNNYSMFPGLDPASQLAYDSNTKTLTAIGSLSQTLLTALEHGTLDLVIFGPNGYPLVDNNPNSPSYGHFVTQSVSLLSGADQALVASLYTASQGAPALGASSGAYVVGGMGQFNINAGSISLGNSDGILTVGNGGSPTTVFVGRDYSFLTSYMIADGASGATINVTVKQDQTVNVNGVPTVISSLYIPSSTIAALGGGNVNITSTEGAMDLGSQDLVQFEDLIMNGPTGNNIGLGIYTAGGGDVNVTAHGNINIDSSRIASFNGGKVTVLSETGDVNAGSGGVVAIPINVFSTAYAFPNEPVEYAYANGIAALTLAALSDGSLVPGAATVPGNITVNTPQGSIYANLGGILQESLSGTLAAGPTVDLTAGTPNPPDDWNSILPPLYGPPQDGVGNIQLGASGVIGGTVNVKATGKVTGLLISSQNANVTSESLGSLTVLAGGTANVSSQGSSGGITIIGAQGVNASGVGSGALLLGQNVSVNGSSAQSTLGNSATATTTSQAAAQQSTESASQQVAGNNSDDEDQNKKKKPQVRRVSRVTVILSSAIPPE